MLHHKVMHHEGRDCSVGAHKWFFITVGLFVMKVKECALSYPPVPGCEWSSCLEFVFMQNPTFSLCALSLLWREMRGRCSVCLCNQTLTACQGKACRVKRLNCGLDFKRAKYDEVYSLSIKVACGCREMFWIKKQMPVHLFCTFNVFVCDFCSEKRFSGFCS